MQATHTLDGQEAERRGPDNFGRYTFYDPTTGTKLSAKGKVILPIVSESGNSELPPEQLQQEGAAVPSDAWPQQFPFHAVAVAMSAILAGHGYAERFGFVAHRDGDRAAILSVPSGGGHKRYRVEFPELMAVPAEAVE